jgi:hypothetical protein
MRTTEARRRNRRASTRHVMIGADAAVAGRRAWHLSFGGAMTSVTVMTRHCEAKTRSGGVCRRPAGWGTPHPRRRRCKLHGGSTPAQIAHEAARTGRTVGVGRRGYGERAAPQGSSSRREPRGNSLRT